MDYYGHYILLGFLFVGAAFFITAILKLRSGKKEVLKFTAYGFIMLALTGLYVSLFGEFSGVRVAISLFLILGAIYYWFYQGNIKDDSGDN